MRSFMVVVIGPGLEMGVALRRIGPVFGVGPFSESGLDKAFSFAVGLWGIGFGAVVADREFITGMSEQRRGNANRAVLAVARKMVAYLLAVDRRNTDFIPAGEFMPTGTA